MKKDMIKDSLHDNGQPLFLALSEPPGKTFSTVWNAISTKLFSFERAAWQDCYM